MFLWPHSHTIFASSFRVAPFPRDRPCPLPARARPLHPPRSAFLLPRASGLPSSGEARHAPGAHPAPAPAPLLPAPVSGGADSSPFPRSSSSCAHLPGSAPPRSPRPTESARAPRAPGPEIRASRSSERSLRDLERLLPAAGGARPVPGRRERADQPISVQGGCPQPIRRAHGRGRGGRPRGLGARWLTVTPLGFVRPWPLLLGVVSGGWGLVGDPWSWPARRGAQRRQTAPTPANKAREPCLLAMSAPSYGWALGSRLRKRLSA